MNKYRMFILALVCILCQLFGCSRQSMNDIIKNQPSIHGVITQVHDTYIMIDLESETYSDNSACTVSLDVENSDGLYSPMNIGDEVVVYFDGLISETYPMQINNVYAITLETPANRQTDSASVSTD